MTMISIAILMVRTIEIMITVLVVTRVATPVMIMALTVSGQL